MKDLKMYINGEFVESSSGKWIEVLNPSTEEVISRQPDGTVEDVNRALDAAKNQFIGQLVVASDNNEALALSVGKSFLYHGKVESNAATAAHIAAVTAQQLMDAASLILPDKASVLTFK